jgi:hypothetical protein
MIAANGTNQTLTGIGSGDTFVFNSAAVGQDTITNFHADTDVLQFKASMFAGTQAVLDAIHDDGHGNTVIAVDAPTPHSEARVDTTGGNATLQIDVNGDGVMDAHDIEIHLTNYTGTLHDSNFLLS